MLKQLLVAASAWSAISAFALTPVGTVIFSDSFDAYTLGENRTVLGNGWRITSGSLNVIGEDGFDPWPGNGRYLDLRGTTGGPVTLSRTFEIDTAGFYGVTSDVAGSPRGNHAAVRFSTGPAFGTDGTFTIFNIPSDMPFLGIGGVATGLREAGSFELTITTPSVVNGIPTDASALIDDVAVTLVAVPVPEPATWALLLCGLGAVAAFGRGAHRRATMSATSNTPATRQGATAEAGTPMFERSRHSSRDS
jgi:hypothetical protein